MNGMVASIKHLNDWNRSEVANRLKEMGMMDDVPLSEYRFLYGSIQKSETFGRLVEFFRSV